MVPVFDKAAVVDHGNVVRHVHGGEPVRHQDGDAPQETAETALRWIHRTRTAKTAR